MTNIERVLELVRRQPGLDDDQISSQLKIRPRQQVNQICHRLKDQGLIRREIGRDGKIVNLPADGPRSLAGYEAIRGPIASPPEGEQPIGYLANTLLMLTCSAGKDKDFAGYEQGPSILDELPSALAAALKNARRAVQERAQVDERTLQRAWRRYRPGGLYEEVGDVLGAALERGTHVLILSGGYGVVRADEPIGVYNREFDARDWPAELLEDCLLAYARAYGLRRVIAMASRTTPYADVVRRVPWSDAGVGGYLFTPRAPGNPRRENARTIGLGLRALLAQGISPEDWRGRDGRMLLPEPLG